MRSFAERGGLVSGIGGSHGLRPLGLDIFLEQKTRTGTLCSRCHTGFVDYESHRAAYDV